MAATDLRIPGPTPLPPEVLQAMQTEMTPPRNAEFREFFSELLAQMRRFHGTSDAVLVLPGSGSAGFEFTLVNSVSPGDKVLAVSCGSFGERYASVAETLGLDVVRVELPWGSAVTSSILAKALDENPGVKAVLLTYSETSTGVANPVHEVGKLVHDHGALLLVDAVSAAGGIPIEMDAWGIDMVFSGSQKAWMCPPGLVIVGVGKRAFEAYEKSTFRRFFFDLKIAAERAKEGTTPTTPPMTMLYALKAAADLIDAEGLNNVYDRHARLGAFVRRGVAELGYRIVADEEYVSDTVTAIYPPDGIEPADVIARMKADHGIDIASGLGKLQSTTLRIGHMGYTHQPDLERTLTALSSVTDQLRR
ncbi:MAG TPA: alanine--glyoxylate aminotransferase family protein [Nitrolancea sp.]|nr:alanine--glyoxylate aminotransferase family protein [Nitrolancea sp.]